MAAQPGDRIQRQTSIESLAFMAFVDSQTGQQSHGLGTEARSTTEPLRQIGDRKTRQAPGVISNDVGLIPPSVTTNTRVVPVPWDCRATSTSQ